MLAMLPRLKTTPPHQISSYLTLTKKLIANVFVKGIFGGRRVPPSGQFKRRFHGGFTSVARSASLALEESFSFSWWLATSRRPRQRACAIERASVELSHQLI
jgi:hypothetical protein